MCLYCHKPHVFALTSNEARGVFNVFCPGGQCEDRYAAGQMSTPKSEGGTGAVVGKLLRERAKYPPYAGKTDGDLIRALLARFPEAP